jgi:hypothetical protein
MTRQGDAMQDWRFAGQSKLAIAYVAGINRKRECVYSPCLRN